MPPETITNEQTNEGGATVSDAARTAVLAAASGHILARAIHVVSKIGVADLLVAGPRRVGELARATATDELALHRLLHFLARHGFFKEDADGLFGLTETGAMLGSKAPANTAAVIDSLGSPAVWDAFGSLLEAVRTGKPPEHRREGRLYASQHAQPNEGVLSRAMMGYHAGEPEAVVATYDFARVRMVIDVGGSSGTLLSAILLRHHHLTGIVYDRPETAAEAGEAIARRGLTARCSFVGGNFFRSVPEGGDLYVLSHVLHDWGYEDALRILVACRRAMQTGARLLILEALMSASGVGEAEIPADMLLLANAEGKLRTREEHRALLDDAGFQLTRILPCGAKVTLIEAEPKAM